MGNSWRIRLQNIGELRRHVPYIGCGFCDWWLSQRQWGKGRAESASLSTHIAGEAAVGQGIYPSGPLGKVF